MNVHAWVLEACKFSVYKQLTFFLCVFHLQIIIFSSDFCPHHHSMMRQSLTLLACPSKELEDQECKTERRR